VITALEYYAQALQQPEESEQETTVDGMEPVPAGSDLG
jgi:hypothetical protein